MKKLEADSPETKSANIVSDNIEVLKSLFPEAFTEGKIDFEVLKALLGGSVDEREEKYGLNWHGKRRARQIALTPSAGTLLPCPEESVEWDTTRNLMIEGDNLEVIKLLQKSYSNKIKFIYIDPPYNTGNDFVYPDNFQDSISNYLELTSQVEGVGLKITSNPEVSGRFHTDWLNMMYPRLKLARNLLTEDGVICISIDDNELYNIRFLMNELYGQENFVACIIWQKMDSPSRNEETRYVSNYHDYILIYSKNFDRVGLKKKSKPEILNAYPFTLPDGRLARRRQLRKNGKSARRQDRETLWFPLTAPDGTEVWPIAPEGWEGRWVLSKETWREREAQNLTQWIKRDYGWVPYYIETAPGDPGVPWPTIWSDVDQNRQAKAEYTSLVGQGVEFDSPKPSNLIKQLLRMATSGEDICLDFFAGSGTTAQAVLDLNKEDGSIRRFVVVQLPEPLAQSGEKSPKTIAEITRLRIRKAIERLSSGGGSDNLDLDDAKGPTDRGFRVFKLASSNIRAWEPDVADLEDSLLKNAEHLVQGRKEQDVLYELLLKLGLDLCVPIETKTIAGKTVHSIGGGTLIVCLSDGLTKDVVEELAKGIVEWRKALAPAVDTRVVFKDNGFADDIAKTNMAAILNQAGIADVRSL